MQVKSNIIRGGNIQRKKSMAKVIDGVCYKNEKHLPRVHRWKVYNLLHAFHPDTYDAWRPIGGRKTDGEYYECYHDEHIVRPSSVDHYGKVIDNSILLPTTINSLVFSFEDFAAIHHNMKIMTLHTEYLHEQEKSIVEYSLRHDRLSDAKVYDDYREWVIYVVGTKGATKGKGIPFRCERILHTELDPIHWIYVFNSPETFTVEDEYGPTQPCWRIHLRSREGMLTI